jgi:hypothetical protein
MSEAKRGKPTPFGEARSITRGFDLDGRKQFLPPL